MALRSRSVSTSTREVSAWRPSRQRSTGGFGLGLSITQAYMRALGGALTSKPKPSHRVLADAAFDFLHYGALAHPSVGVERSPWTRITGFRLNAASRAIVRARYGEEVLALEAPETWSGEGSGGIRGGENAVVQFDRGEAYEFTLDTGERAEGEAAAGDGAILSPMPGKIISVAAKPGAKVKKGEPLLVLEAMKMEHTLTAPFDGKVAELKAKAGDQVIEGALLAKLEA